MPLTLKVLTPEHELLDEPVEQVTAQGALGQFGVLPEHTTYLTALDPGILVYRTTGGGEGRLAVKGGYAEVKNDVMTVLADDAIPVEDVDPSAARAELQRATAALAERDFGHPEHEAARRELRWAEVLSDLASRGGS
jgi:F-type H+-transporting ATPase subunit epsilon